MIPVQGAEVEFVRTDGLKLGAELVRGGEALAGVEGDNATPGTLAVDAVATASADQFEAGFEEHGFCLWRGESGSLWHALHLEGTVMTSLLR